MGPIFQSQLAFLHHEDFLNQLGQEAVPKYDETVKMEMPDEEMIPFRNELNFNGSIYLALV